VKRSLVIITVLILLISLLPPYPRRATADEYTYYTGSITWDGSDGLNVAVEHDDYLTCEIMPANTVDSGFGNPAASLKDTRVSNSRIQIRCEAGDNAEVRLVDREFDYYKAAGAYYYVEYTYTAPCDYDDSLTVDGCDDWDSWTPFFEKATSTWDSVSFPDDEGYATGIALEWQYGGATQWVDNLTADYEIRVSDSGGDDGDDPYPGGFYYPVGQGDLLASNPTMTLYADDATIAGLYFGQEDRAGVFANMFSQPYEAENYEEPTEAPELDPLLTDMNDYALLYQSDSVGDYVHSFGPGRVESITAISVSDCSNSANYTNDNTTLAESLIAAGIGMLVGGPAGAVAAGGETFLVSWGTYLSTAQPKVCSLDLWSDSWGGYGSDVFVTLPVGDIVEIADYVNGVTYYYLVGDATEYIEAGMMVNNGCVIGRTMPIMFSNPAPGSLQQEITPFGYGAIWAEYTTLETPFDVRYEFGQYAVTDESCNTPSFSECINLNPDFEKLKPALGWSDIQYGDIHLDGDTAAGLELDSSTSTSQILAVNGGTGLSVQLTGSVLTSNTDDSDSVINVDLGDTTHQFTLDAGGASFTEATTLASHSDSAYGDLAMRLTIEQDTGQDGTVLIERVCVSDVEFEPPPLPQCIFVNSGFDANSDWSLTDDARIYGGALELEPGDTASQDIELAADVYDLEVKARALPLTSPTSYSAEVDWSYGLSLAPTNVFDDGTATASAGDPSDLFDGSDDLYSYWDTNTAAAPQWVEVELSESTTIHTYKITAHQTGTPTVWQFQYWDGDSWETADSVTVTEAWDEAEVRTYTLDSDVTATKFRLYITDCDRVDDRIIFREFEGYPAAVDPIASGDFSSAVSTWNIYTDTFTVSTASDASFSFVSSGSDIAQIDYVCLIPQNQPVAPSDPDVVDVVGCQSCPATYTGNNPGDVVEAITWLDCRLRQVYQCDMRQILVDTRDATQETVRGIGMAGRWASASANINNKFLRSIAWYLGGHLNNVALMLSDTINYSGGAGITIIDSSGNLSFWDVIGLLFEGLRDVLMGLLDTINNLFTFLAPIVGTLADVILAAVDILQSVINAILGQVESVWYFVQALVDATATAPQTIEGMPDCTAGLASGDADWYCWGFYIIDNTIFAGPAQYFLPIVMAFAAFNLLVWGFRRVTNAMAAAG
jgi:hypothetical protein